MNGLVSAAYRLGAAVLGGREPAPAQFIQQRSYYPWLVVATTCIGAFIGQLDASIVQLTLPELEHVFDSQVEAVSWVALAYTLAFAAVLPVYARLAEITGRKLMYLLGFGLFGLASALCGFAPSLPWLIAFRTLQGLSGAMLGANSIVILVATAGPARRAEALGIFSAAQAVGVSAGPAMGGMILSVLTWHWVFWVNVPFAVIGVVTSWLVIPKTTALDTDRRFDWRGALYLVPALIALMLALAEVHAWGPRSPGLLICIAAGLGLLVAFIRQERSTPTPLIDLKLFRAPAFSGGAVAAVLSYAMLYGMFFTMAFALVRGYHDPPLAAGLRLTIIPVAVSLVAPFSGTLHERFPRLVMLGGMALCIVASLALTQLVTGSKDTFALVMIALAIFGAGLGLFIGANNSATIGAAPAARSGAAGGLLNLMRVGGTSIGLASASSMLAWRLNLRTGVVGGTMGAPQDGLLAAVGDVLVMLAIFAIVAGAATLPGTRPGARRRSVAVPEVRPS